MALKGGFSRATPLQMALDRGLRPGATVGDELRQLGEYCIKAKSDAEALCRVLARCVSEGTSLDGENSLHAVIGLFQEVEGPECPAFSTMIELGMPILVDLVDAGCAEESGIDPEDVLFALKILVIYGTIEGTDAVVRAVQRSFHPDSYWWHLILQPYGDGHPESGRLFQTLSDPLPDDFLAFSLLDCANAALAGGAGHEHPFDNEAGQEQLERWLTDHDQGHFTYAVGAVAALPYISSPARDRLLTIAAEHSNDEVRLEAAYASARLGHEDGIEGLARYCLDVDHAEKAREYLETLNRDDAVPTEALDADFRARAAFSRWLAHPSELGRAPDELEIIDRRELNWPPELDRKTLWLIKYRLRDTTGLIAENVGLGLVGSVTFCLADAKLEQHRPETAYAAHCYWELEAKGYITEAEVEDDSTEYDGMLRQARLAGLSRARIIRVIELSPAIKYPQRLIALARATKNGDEGWVVVDGPRSRWYAGSETSSDRSGRLAVMIHVGRVLLDLRNKFRSGD
jgi:hypothetical protein